MLPYAHTLLTPEEIVEKLAKLLRNVPTQLRLISDEHASEKPTEDHWSIKELVGHLCDSALNNHYRFLFSLTREKTLKVEPYQQDQWVILSGYQQRPWHELIEGWEFLNKSILSTLQQKLEDHELYGRVQTGSQFVTLEELISDYIGHLEHHLRQITSKTGVAFW